MLKVDSAVLQVVAETSTLDDILEMVDIAVTLVPEPEKKPSLPSISEAAMIAENKRLRSLVYEMEDRLTQAMRGRGVECSICYGRDPSCPHRRGSRQEEYYKAYGYGPPMKFDRF